MKTYTCIGHATGQCGVLHKTLTEVEKCMQTFSHASIRRGVYNDRGIYLVENNDIEAAQKCDKYLCPENPENAYFEFAVGLENREGTISVEDAINIYRRKEGQFVFSGWEWTAIQYPEKYGLTSFSKNFENISEILEYLNVSMETYIRDIYVEWRGGNGVFIRCLHIPAAVFRYDTHNEIKIRKGHQYYGSACYSAGYRVISGNVTERIIPNTHKDNGFAFWDEYIISPIGGNAIIEIEESSVLYPRAPYKVLLRLMAEQAGKEPHPVGK